MNNKLHEHLTKCPKKDKNGPRRTTVIKAEPRPALVVASEVRLEGTGSEFKRWIYCTIKASLTEFGHCELICLDSGNTVTLVDRQWLLQQKPDARIQRMDKPIGVRGVENGRVEAAEFVILELFIPGEYDEEGMIKTAKAKLTVEAHIMDKLAANMLLGSDVLVPNGMIIDGEKRELRIQACKGMRTKLDVSKGA